jgi:hypothetical protein
MEIPKLSSASTGFYNDEKEREGLTGRVTAGGAPTRTQSIPEEGPEDNDKGKAIA